ncbi:MAG: hypothetical protein C5B45_02450 [Chlamydiae bacterium]|nr:MAG: hypothetical protein C5B45_02450 [Chlamydiota bacterium]
MEDIDDHVCRLETKINKRNERLDSKMIKLEERRFWLVADKKLEDAILEERIKSSKIYKFKKLIRSDLLNHFSLI